MQHESCWLTRAIAEVMGRKARQYVLEHVDGAKCLDKLEAYYQSIRQLCEGAMPDASDNRDNLSCPDSTTRRLGCPSAGTRLLERGDTDGVNLTWEWQTSWWKSLGASIAVGRRRISTARLSRLRLICRWWDGFQSLS